MAPWRARSTASRARPRTRTSSSTCRQLAWYRLGNQVSDREWRDLLGVLRVQGDRLDRGYLERGARELGLEALLAEALAEARIDPAR